MTAALQLVDMEVRTPVGLTAASAAAAVRAAICRIGEHPFVIDPLGEPLRGARDAVLDPSLLDHRRIAALATEPLERLCARLPAKLGRELTVIVAFPEHRPGFGPSEERVALEMLTGLIRLKFQGARVVTSKRGHAGVLDGIRSAAAFIAERSADFCVVGGADSYFHPQTLDWLFSQNRAVTSETRAAFFPGEAGAFLALTSPTMCRHLRLRPLAEVRGAEVAMEQVPISSDEECFGKGLSEAVRGSTAALRQGERVDRVICDINGERYRSQEWGMAVLRIRPDLFDDPTAYEAPATAWGDVGAASGALFAVLAAQGWARGYARGPYAFIFAGSDTGLRAGVLMAQSGGGG